MNTEVKESTKETIKLRKVCESTYRVLVGIDIVSWMVGTVEWDSSRGWLFTAYAGTEFQHGQLMCIAKLISELEPPKSQG